MVDDLINGDIYAGSTINLTDLDLCLHYYILKTTAVLQMQCLMM